MNDQTSKTLRVFAPAKINLYLHVTGQRENGYHTLDSLVGFADIGDEIQISSAEDFRFEITGPFANAFHGRDIDASPESSNLAVRAVWALSRLAEKAPAFKITLQKNLPLGAGIGGGSADAAAVLWGLLEYWNLSADLDGLDALMIMLGADVPVCFACKTLHVSGIGEKLKPVSPAPEIPIVLVHPGKACNTKEIFNRFKSDFSETITPPAHFNSATEMIDFLADTENMLTSSALHFVPEIQNTMRALSTKKDCLLSRMSGSGSTCFGLFDDMDQAEKAAENLMIENPDWWVKSGWLGRPERY